MPAGDDPVNLVASAYASLGGAVSTGGDLPQARKVLLEGLVYVESQRGRRGADYAAGSLGHRLSHLAFDLGNYQEALARASQAVQFFDEAATRLPPGAPDRAKTHWHRQAAAASAALGRAERALGHPDAAEAAFDRGLKHAHLVGLREPEVELLLEQGHLASSRQDWSKALDFYERGLPLAVQIEVHELFGLDLDARLVFLSACETGLGKLSRGDEIVGLQRAFLYAGTAAVITTLWKVGDRASFELVRAFSARLPNAGVAEALRQAQVEALRAFPHPFAWAAFTLTGVPR